MDIDPISMLEISLQELPSSEAETIQVDVDPSYLQVNDYTVVKDEKLSGDEYDSVGHSMGMVYKNGNKLALVSNDEEAYRKKVYKSTNIVLRKRLHCTVCDVHIGCHLDLNQEDIEHPLLKVLACTSCTFSYKHIAFPLSAEGHDVRCRWCTKPSTDEAPLRFCTSCPFAFCEMCIYRNLPLDELSRKRGTTIWNCVVCNISELYPSRAVLWALNSEIQFNKSRITGEKWTGDISTCCKSAKLKPTRLLTLPNVIPKRTNGYQNIKGKNINIFRKNLGSKFSIGNNIKINNTQKALPGSKYESQWLKEKISNICKTFVAINANLCKVSNSMGTVEEKFSIRSKVIAVTSILESTCKQIASYKKDLDTNWKKVVETRSLKLVDPDVYTPKQVPYVRNYKNVKSDFNRFMITSNERFYLQKYDIKPCYVRLEHMTALKNILRH